MTRSVADSQVSNKFSRENYHHKNEPEEFDLHFLLIAVAHLLYPEE